MNKTVLITGASRGIGAAIAVEFAKNGFKVAVNYNKSSEKALALCEELCAQGFLAKAFYADVKNEEDINSMLHEISAELGGIDILVNNAGVSSQRLFTDITAAEWDEMFSVNVRAAFLVSRAALPYMINKKWGRIINIASMWGEEGASCEVHYSASKAALIGLTKALAKEEALSGITVNCVSPGAIETDMLSCFSEDDISAICDETPIPRLGTPTEIAAAVYFLASDSAAYITGQTLSVNGGRY